MELLGTEAALIVSGAEGLDELSIEGTSYLAAIGLPPLPAELRPEDAGLPSHPLEDLRGGDAAYNAEALRRLLLGETGAYRDAVLGTVPVNFLSSADTTGASSPAVSIFAR